MRLENEVASYLDSRHKILSVSGPTKTGKTVLLRSQVSEDFDPIWLSGGAVTTVEDFWSTIADELELPTETGMDGGVSQTQSGNISGELSGGFIKGGGGKATALHGTAT